MGPFEKFSVAGDVDGTQSIQLLHPANKLGIVSIYSHHGALVVDCGRVTPIGCESFYTEY